jgi:hypothetical protein
LETTIYFALAGAQYVAGGQEALEKVSVPTLASYHPIEGNAYDEEAVGIYLGETLIGYVPNQGHTCPQCFYDYGKKSLTWWCASCGYQGSFLKTGLASRLRRFECEGALSLIEKFHSVKGIWSARFRLDLLKV